jgi:hypothetical protein
MDGQVARCPRRGPAEARPSILIPECRFACRFLHCRSAVDQALRALGVPSSLHRNLGGGAFDLPEIAMGEFDGGRRDVFLQAMQLRRPWNRYDPGLLGQQPGECNLGRRRLLALSNVAEQIDQRPVPLPGLRRKAGDGVAEIGGVEGSTLVDLPGGGWCELNVPWTNGVFPCSTRRLD